MTTLGMESTRWVVLALFEVDSMDEVRPGPEAKAPLWQLEALYIDKAMIR